MTAFLYSVVRFCPDTFKGELVNVGLIVGDPGTGEWVVRRLRDNDLVARAGAFAGEHLRVAWEYLARLDTAAGGFTSEWLWQEHHDKQNLVQLSRPAPAALDTMDAAVELLHRNFLTNERLGSQEGGGNAHD